MGGVFAGAAQAPLTAIASVVEMTGNFTLTLPIMLASGIAAALSKQLSHGSVYTTKLLRRGIDIERPRPDNVLETLSVADVMTPVTTPNGLPRTEPEAPDGELPEEIFGELGAVVQTTRNPQELFEDETLEQALRQLTLYGRSGLPVLSADRRHVRGWITRRDVLAALARSIETAGRGMETGAVAADFGAANPQRAAHASSAPLAGYEIIDLSITSDSPAAGRRIGEVAWPDGAVVVAITDGAEMVPALEGTTILPGERIIVLAPARATGDRSSRPTPPDRQLVDEAQPGTGVLGDDVTAQRAHPA
jgi:CIC family chloride channel protein